MELFRFANSQYLYALVLIPILTFVYIAYRVHRKKQIKNFGNPELLGPLMPNVSSSRPTIKFIINMLALSFLIIAIARPQFGSKLRKIKRQGVEIMIALDVSNSMMAEDIQPNRLERAKRAISRLTERLTDDKIGMIVFAGDAYTQLPITNDYASAKLFLGSINTSIVPKQGTAIGAAIELGTKSFTPESETSKALIIITDGENHEDNATEMAKMATENGVVIHTIGMGLPKGGPIPVYNQYGQKDYRKDKDGNVIVTKLNEEMLQEISAAGNGVYIRANNTEIGLNRLFDEINKMQKTELESRIYSDYNDQFMYFIAAALFLILLEYLILERKNNLFRNISLFSDKKDNENSI